MKQIVMPNILPPVANVPEKVVVILSGGMDSAVVLWLYKTLGYELHAISFDYGQRHKRELHSAGALAHFAGCASHEVVDMSSIKSLLKGSSQTDLTVPVPHGHYTAENMKKTVVPNRNMIMISVAAAHAIALKAPTLAYGAHAGDHAIYPDCRPEFGKALAKAILLGDWNPPRLAAPFVDMTKTQITRLGHKLGVPFDETWSCYDPQVSPLPFGYAHCGKCGTCVERREAFALAGVSDPTVYVSRPDPE